MGGSRTTRRVAGIVAVAGLALGVVPSLVAGAASDTTEPAAESTAPASEGSAPAPATELPDLSGQSLTISNWDAYTPENLIPSFEEGSGASVEFTTHATNEEIVAKLLQGGGEGYDVVFVSAQFAQQLDEAGLLLDIDPELVPNLSYLAPEALELDSDPGLRFSVPVHVGHDRTVLPQRRHHRAADELDGPPRPGRGTGRTGDDDGNRPVAVAAGPEGARLLGQHD